MQSLLTDANGTFPNLRDADGYGFIDDDPVLLFITKAKKDDAQRRRDEEVEAFCRDVAERCCEAELLELARKSPKTEAIYLTELKGFVEYCREWRVTCFPAGPGLVSSYLGTLIAEDASQEKLRRVSAAIAHAHTIRDLPDPTESLLVRAVLKSSRRGTNANG